MYCKYTVQATPIIPIFHKLVLFYGVEIVTSLKKLLVGSVDSSDVISIREAFMLWNSFSAASHPSSLLCNCILCGWKMCLCNLTPSSLLGSLISATTLPSFFLGALSLQPLFLSPVLLCFDSMLSHPSSAFLSVHHPNAHIHCSLSLAPRLCVAKPLQPLIASSLLCLQA